MYSTIISELLVLYIYIKECTRIEEICVLFSFSYMDAVQFIYYY